MGMTSRVFWGELEKRTTLNRKFDRKTGKIRWGHSPVYFGDHVPKNETIKKENWREKKNSFDAEIPKLGGIETMGH